MSSVGIQETEFPLLKLFGSPTIVFLSEFGDYFYANRKVSFFLFDQRLLARKFNFWEPKFQFFSLWGD